jgi:glycosyltransferase involved in cell wall biosynthesis
MAGGDHARPRPDAAPLLFTITRYWPAIGGAELHTRELLKHLDGAFRPIVAAHWDTNRTDWLLGTTLLAPRYPKVYRDDARPVHLVAPTLTERIASAPLVVGYYPLLPLASARLGRTLARHLEAVEPAPALVHNVRSGREPLTLASRRLARSQGVPFVFTPNHHPRWVGWRYWVYHEVYRRADALIALTEAEKRTLVELGAAPERVHVTGIGPVLADAADAERARRTHDLPDRYVLFLGQMHAYKGLDAVLAAAPGVWHRHPDVGFVFAGPTTSYSQGLFARVADRKIRCLGRVDLQDKTDLLAGCEVVCVPSAQESFGGVIVEGWGLGKPVIAGPAPAAAEVIDDGVDGFFAPVQTGEAIASRLNQLLDDPDRATTMGERGRVKVQQRFGWAALASRMGSVYRSLL